MVAPLHHYAAMPMADAIISPGPAYRAEQFLVLHGVQGEYLEIREIYGEEAGYIVPGFANDGNCMLLFQHSGRSHLVKEGGTDICEGEWAWMSHMDRCPVRVGRHSHCVMILAGELPSDRGCRFSRGEWVSGPGRLLAHIISGLLAMEPSFDPRSSTIAAASIIQLASALISDDGNRGAAVPQEPRNIMKERICHYIEQNIKRPDLSVGVISAELRCSKRYLHKAFNGNGETLAAVINRIRLERCRQTLMDAAAANRSITDVAFEWGFDNASHFSRTFRRQFGLSPREFRNRSLAMV